MVIKDDHIIMEKKESHEECKKKEWQEEEEEMQDKWREEDSITISNSVVRRKGGGGLEERNFGTDSKRDKTREGSGWEISGEYIKERGTLKKRGGTEEKQGKAKQRGIAGKSLTLAAVGNVTSKRNGVTRYRFSHALRAITIKSDNVSRSLER